MYVCLITLLTLLFRARRILPLAISTLPKSALRERERERERENERERACE